MTSAKRSNLALRATALVASALTACVVVAAALAATPVTATASVAGQRLSTGNAAAGAIPALAPTTTNRSDHRPHGDRVSKAIYNLGDGAFTDPKVTFFDDPKTPVPQELAGVVHYPTHLGRKKHPLIMIVHGFFWTCVDRKAKEPTEEWPCAKGTQPLRSYRGYDYLARRLAERGFVVVSISANAINAHVLGEGGYERAHLLNKHLAMWQRLVNRGAGPLRHAFVDPGTGDRVRTHFRGRVDTRNVGTIGHSRAGKSVMWQAADKHRSEWPAHVRVRAVLPLAPVYFTPPRQTKRATLVSDIPFKVITSTCDGDTGEIGASYVNDAKSINPDASLMRILGGNHNFFNTRWSPGNIGGKDDGIKKCPDRLTAEQQRRRTKRVVVSFFVETLGKRGR